MSNINRRRLLTLGVGAPIGLSIGLPALGQPQARIIIASGGPNGTYYKLVEDMKKSCKGVTIDHWLSEDGKPSTGATVSLEALRNNQAHGAIVQMDGLARMAKQDPQVRKTILALMPLHEEEVHLIAPATGRYFNLKAPLKSLAELKDRKVGYWGGSSVTLQAINGLLEIGWKPISFPGQPEALEALKRNDVDVILAVGGQPLGWVKGLPNIFKLLSFSDGAVAELSDYYHKAKLSYANLEQSGVQTISVQALLVTRDYKSQSILEMLSKGRQCIIDAVPEMRETVGTHPKWQEINPAAAARWPMPEWVMKAALNNK